MAKQKRLVEEGLIKEIVDIADEYRQVRDERMEALKREVGLKERLIAAMHNHNRDYYSYEGIEIEIVTGPEKVKVRKAQEESEDTDE